MKNESPMLVLVVEDHQDTLDMFTTILGERFAVVGRGSAAEALKTLRIVRPDVVMLDIGMAPVDGLECLEAIRAMPGYETLPAVAVTGHAREVDRQRFLAAGFQAVLTKPLFDEEELIAAIRRAVGESLTGHAKPGTLSDCGNRGIPVTGAA
jgi:CheY-like chemotaxis protein